MVIQVQAQSAAGPVRVLRIQPGLHPLHPHHHGPALLPRSANVSKLLAKLKQLQPSGRLLIHVSSQIEKWQGTPGGCGKSVPVIPLLYPENGRPSLWSAGQVYNPIAITYSTGKHAGWYSQAGGRANRAWQTRKRFLSSAPMVPLWAAARGEWFSGNVLSTTLQAWRHYLRSREGAAGGAFYKNLNPVNLIAFPAPPWLSV